MSPKRQRNACGKVVYTSESEASDVAVRRMVRGAQQLRVYFCRECRGWHITSRPRIWHGRYATGGEVT